MAKWLVTGGAGFIGSNIVEELLKRRQKVRVLDNFCTGRMSNIRPFLKKIQLIKGDIRSAKTAKKALKNIDYVLHQAALRSVPRSIDNPIANDSVNIKGTLNMLMESKNARVKRFVMASSSSVYGDSKILPQSEQHRPSPISPYAVSKVAGEYYCRVFAKTFGLETVALRYFNVFGPRQDPKSKYAAVIPKFMLAALRSEPLEIHGDGLQSRDFTYIDNVVQANILAAQTKGISGEVFNIAVGKTSSVLDIYYFLTGVSPKKVSKYHTPPRKGDVRKTNADIKKAKWLLRYQPKVFFQEGLQKTWDYIRK